MSKTKPADESTTTAVRTQVPAPDVEAAILAGGEVVGTTADDEPLVEGPNSK